MSARAAGDAPPAWGSRRFWRGVWRVADPKTTLASAASLLLGACAAAHDGPLSWGALLLTVLGVFLVEAAKNASGELFDFDSGTDLRVTEEDRSPFSGGKRVLVDGLWTRAQTKAVAAAFYAGGAACGLALAAREPWVLAFALAGGALAYFYHAPPVALSYRGLGELAVCVTYGPLLCAGVYLVQRGDVPWRIAVLAVPLGLMIAAFLFVNEFPDARADEASGKRTLVVRLGRLRASRAFVALPAAAFSLLLALPAFGLPRGTWLGLLGLPHAVAAASRLRTHPETTHEVVPAQAWTLLSFVLLAAGASAGMLPWR